MRNSKLNKPILGIDQLSDETDLIHSSQKRITAIREGLNIDIDNDGNVSRRKGFVELLSDPGFHSLYSSKRGLFFMCNKQELGIYNQVTNVFAVLTNMSESYKTSFTELNGNVYFMNPGSMGFLRGDETAIRPLGVALPDTSAEFTASTSGGFAPGSYAIAFSVVNDLGEESPLSDLKKIVLEDGGSVLCSMLTILPGFKYRFYMTSTDGDELYQAMEIDANVTSIIIADHGTGRRPLTKNLSRLPFGYIIRAHGSRLFIATDDFVFFSEAFLPHLTNSANDFIPITGFALMMESVDGGLYVGDKTGVTFYQGHDPGDFIPKKVSDESPVFGTAVTVPGSFLPEKYMSEDSAAIWLSESGYHIGLSNGQVVKLHAKQVLLPRYTQGCTAFSVRDGRKQLVTPVNSNVLAGASVALDSTF